MTNSFRDYVQVAVKRKKMIALFGLVTFLSTGIVLVFSTKVYEAHAIVRLGSVEGEWTRVEAIQLIKSDSFLKEVSLSLGGEILPQDLQGRLEREKNFMGFREGYENYLIMNFRDPDPEVALRILRGITDHLVLLSRVNFDRQMLIMNERVMRFDRELKEMQERISEVKKNLSFRNREHIENQVDSLERPYVDLLETRLVTLKNIAMMRSAEVYSQPAVSKTPVEPRYLPQLLFSAIVGLLAGFLAACIREFWSQA